MAQDILGEREKSEREEGGSYFFLVNDNIFDSTETRPSEANHFYKEKREKEGGGE